MNEVCFLSHPYHRGGVTQWMANSFNILNNQLAPAYFISINPSQHFISGANRPLVLSLLHTKWQHNIFLSNQGKSFELGTTEYRASVYKRLINNNVPTGTPLIPSDDEACWMAAAGCAAHYPMVAILHADEEIYFSLLNQYQHYVSVCICVSNRILGQLKIRFPQLASRAMAIPCGIPVEDFFPATSKENMITWIGRLSRYQKRAQDIIPVFKHARDLGLNFTLQILGHGDYDSAIKEEINRANLKETVALPGWVNSEQVSNSLSKAKVFLQTSDFEGTSVAMMEALASGCSIVSTRVSGVEDLCSLEEAQNVIYLYEPGDMETGARLLHQAAMTVDVHTVQQARVLALQFFDCNRNNRKLIDFVNRVTSQLNRVQGAYQIPLLSQLLSLPLAVLRGLKWRITSTRLNF